MNQAGASPLPTSKNAKQADSLLFIGQPHNSTVTMPQSYLSQLDANIYLLSNWPTITR